MKKAALFSMAVILASNAFAQITDIITLKNENIYGGYISVQESNGNITFNADSLVITIDADRVARKDKGTEGNLTIADLSVKPDSVVKNRILEVYRDALILEEGSRIKFIAKGPRKVEFKMSDVEQIDKPLPEEGMVFGIVDQLTTKSGTVYTGNIISSEPGKRIKIRQSDGKIITLDQKDLATQSRLPLEETESILLQTPLLENIYTTRQEKPFEGVLIVEQNLQNGDFTIVDKTGNETTFKRSELKKIERVPNKDYQNEKVFQYKAGAVYLDKTELARLPYTVKDGKIILDNSDISQIASFKRNETYSIEEAEKDSEGSILYKFIPDPKKKDKIELNASDLFFNQVYPEGQEVSPRTGIVTTTYQLQQGYYVLVNQKMKKISLFYIQ